MLLRSSWDGRALRLALIVLAVTGCTGGFTPMRASERCFDAIDQDQDGLTDERDPDCALWGATCRPGDGTCERASLVCGPAGVCVPTCDGAATCPAGWACASGTCACTPCVERCNGRDDDCDGRLDESTCAAGETCTMGACACDGREVWSPSTLDLLFVIDDAPGLRDRRDALAAALPSTFTALSTGDLDGDGTVDAAPVSSLHVAFVTTELGVGVDGVAGCGRVGDDGVLSAGTGCAAELFYFETYRDSPLTLATSASCGLSEEPSTCAFGQPLDAALLALSPMRPNAGTRSDYVAPLFHDGTHGQGDSATNDLFLRPGSTLVVLVLTDVDDCSASDVGLYTPSDPRFSDVDGHLRCSSFPDALEPVQAYVDRLLSLRREPHDVFFAALAGLPSSAEGSTPDEILALPAMQITTDPAHPSQLVPACTYTTRSTIDMPAEVRGAEPARRLVEVAREVECRGGSQALGSICDPTPEPALRSILRAIGTTEERRACVHDAP